MKVKRSDYIDAVRKKIFSEKTKRMLMFGTLDPKATHRLRDDDGYMITCDTILQSADNLYTLTQGRDVIANKLAAFSQGDMEGGLANFADARAPDYGDVGSVTTIGAIDVTILSMAQSIIPYVAIDRGMSTQQATIYYNNLVAANSAGGVSAGNTVLGNFSPINSSLTLGAPQLSGSLSVAANSSLVGNTTTVTITLTPGGSGTGIVAGQVVATLNLMVSNTLTTFIGQDFTSNGNIYFTGSPRLTATVNYTSGVVSFVTTANTTTWSAGESVSVTAPGNFNSDTTFSDILRVIPTWTPVSLTTAPLNIILENNLQNIMFMDKTYALASGSGGKTYADVVFTKLTNAYIEAVNMKVIAAFVAATAANGITPITQDLSLYSVSSFAETKNDLINQFMIQLRNKFLKRTAVQPTVFVTGSNGVSLLETHPTKWVGNPDRFKGLNGLAGYYDGYPVFRHSYLDSITATNQATFYLASKYPDNQSGSLVYGEFIPLSSTGAVGNYTNPSQQASGLFSQVGVQMIQNTLVQSGTITLPSGLYN